MLSFFSSFATVCFYYQNGEEKEQGRERERYEQRMKEEKEKS